MLSSLTHHKKELFPGPHNKMAGDELRLSADGLADGCGWAQGVPWVQRVQQVLWGRLGWGVSLVDWVQWVVAWSWICRGSVKQKHDQHHRERSWVC